MDEEVYQKLLVVRREEFERKLMAFYTQRTCSSPVRTCPETEVPEEMSCLLARSEPSTIRAWSPVQSPRVSWLPLNGHTFLLVLSITALTCIAQISRCVTAPNPAWNLVTILAVPLADVCDVIWLARHAQTSALTSPRKDLVL